MICFHNSDRRLFSVDANVPIHVISMPGTTPDLTVMMIGSQEHHGLHHSHCIITARLVTLTHVSPLQRKVIGPK